MCGICGRINLESDLHESKNVLKKMTDSLIHRGPDMEGYWVEGGVALGHRRLSIIDIDGGKQPMISPKGCVLVFNGEIYNYLELRDQLSQSGYVFNTHSDTEVLLAAYEVWGQKCIHQLNGMFSFAIWDPSSRIVFLATDPLGKKPLYYYSEKNVFAFASEIKGLLVLREVKESVAVNAAALNDYLSLGYILSPKTIYSNIHKLPAGNTAVWENGSVKNLSYWNLEDCFNNPLQNRETKENQQHFRELFQDAVKIRMRSDVPLGAFLSGGLDSSSVVSMMKHQAVSKVHAFCMGFENDVYDESSYAADVAKYLDIEFHQEKQKGNLSENISDLIWHLDQPFSDTSIIPMWNLSKYIKKYVTVALSGDGADETFAGYSTYQADRLHYAYSFVPSLIQKGVKGLCSAFIRPRYGKVSWDYKTVQFLKAGGLSREKAHYSWRTLFSDNEKQVILNPELMKEVEGYDTYEEYRKYYKKVEQADFLNQCLYVDIKTWLQDDILIKVDRMSMAHSLEIRCPFLDKRLVEFSAGIKTEEKISGFSQKDILRKVMQSELPVRTLKRKKQGFNSPVDVKKKLDLPFSGLFSGNNPLNAEKEDVTYKYFNLLVLKTWQKMFLHYKKTGEWKPCQSEEV